MVHWKYPGIAVMLALVVSVHLVTAATDTTYYLTQFTMTGYYVMVIMGLCLLIGYAGQISIGHAGFFAIGGYLAALFTTFDLSPHRGGVLVDILEKADLLVVREDLYGLEILHLQPWLSALTAVATTILVAWLFAGPVLKLRGHYLAMATLGFGIIVYQVILGTPIFGEADGLNEVPAFPLGFGLEVSGRFSARVSNYYLAWSMVTLGLLALLNLVGSRVGRALKSIHGAEDASMAVGVDTSRLKLRAFVISAAYAALAGVFLTHYNGGIGPSEASIMKSVRYVAIVAVGGMANLWGAVVMGTVLNFLSLRGFFGSYDDAVFGTILIFIMLFAPEGIIGTGFFRKAGTFLFARKGSRDESA